MTNQLTVHSYPNTNRGQRPRKPLVHILASGDYDVQSVSFHPDDAEAISNAILAAAKSAIAGKRRKPVTIELVPQD